MPMRDALPTVPLLLTGLAVMLAMTLVVFVALRPGDDAASVSLRPECQGQATCKTPRLGLNPDKARRFAEVFRS